MQCALVMQRDYCWAAAPIRPQNLIEGPHKRRIVEITETAGSLAKKDVVIGIADDVVRKAVTDGRNGEHQSLDVGSAIAG